MSPSAPVENYRTIPAFKPPTGSGDGLAAVLEITHTTLQANVNNLGAGTPEKAPKLLKLMQDKKLVDSTNNSVSAEKYTEKKDEIESLESDMEKSDDGVDTSSYGTYSAAEGAYQEIKSKADLVVDKIEAAPAPTYDKDGNLQLLPASYRGELLNACFDALEISEQQITKAITDIQQHAQDIKNSAPITPTYYGSTAPSALPASYLSTGNYTPSESSYSNYTSGSTGGGGKLSDEQLDTAIREALYHNKLIHTTDPSKLTPEEKEIVENWTKGYRVLIFRESGNRPGAINNWDSNAAAGNSSQGLTQTIPTTFKANHVAGTSHNITDPVANIAASINYVQNRYKVSDDGSDLAAKVQQADPTRDAKGY